MFRVQGLDAPKRVTGILQNASNSRDFEKRVEWYATAQFYYKVNAATLQRWIVKRHLLLSQFHAWKEFLPIFFMWE